MMRASYIIILGILLSFLSCSTASNLSETDKRLYSDSKKFATYLWYDPQVQEEYNSYSTDAPAIGKYRLNKWYEEHQNCRPKRVKLLDVKELREGMKTFIYRVKMNCGDKVFSITYSASDNNMLPVSIYTIDFAAYADDAFLNPS